jgi:nuclear pore complex protein Nup93
MHHPRSDASSVLLLTQYLSCRLTQDVTTLEIQPTIEDVFHADTSSVEEYLKQVEEATILAAIQEAQQDTVTSFEHFMEDCMSRDWAASKRQLFGLIAPHSGSVYATGPSAGASGGASGGFRVHSGLLPGHRCSTRRRMRVRGGSRENE